MPPVLSFVIAVLATWRVSHLLSREDGPGAICLRLRRAAGDSLFGKLLNCPYCVSVWIAAPTAWWVCQKLPVSTPVDWLMIGLATSGGACVIERFAPPQLLFEALENPPRQEEELK